MESGRVEALESAMAPRRKNTQTKEAREAALRVRNILRVFSDLPETNDPEAAVIDLLTDIRHYCEAEGIDFDLALRSSDGHWDTER